MNIGIVIRSERKARGLSLKELAEKCGLSPMTLQRIETGKTSPSVATLAQIAQHLLRPLDFFIKEERPRIRVLRKADFHVVKGRRMTLTMIAPEGLVDDNILINLGKADEGRMIDTHTEQGHSFVFMLEGGCIFEHDGVKYELEEGDALYYDAAYPHSVEAKGPHKFFSIFIKDKK